MSDLLIRDVPEHVVTAVDARAAALGLSRSEYLRRQLAADAQRSTAAVTRADLTWFAEAFSDLADPAVMRRAWE